MGKYKADGHRCFNKDNVYTLYLQVENNLTVNVSVGKARLN